MISFERWKDGFVMTVEGSRVLRHSSVSPALYLGLPKRKAAASRAGESPEKPSLAWQSLGACDIRNEGPDRIVLGFGELCVIKISYTDRILRLSFFPSDGSRPGIKLRFGANPRERLFGAGPSTLYDMKRQNIEIPGAGADLPSRRNPTIFSSLGTWIHIKGSGSFAWRFGASATELNCTSIPDEIALGFGKTSAMGMEMLTRYKAGARGGERNPGSRGSLPSTLQAGLILDGTGEGPKVREALETLRHNGIEPCAIIQEPGDALAGNFLVIESGRWPGLLASSMARPLLPGLARYRSATEMVRAILSLSLSGEGQVFLPIEGSSNKGEGAEGEYAEGGRGTGHEALVHAFEMAAFGPLFIVPASLRLNDEIVVRKFVAAAGIYGMLAPYREYCGEEWVEKGIPLFGHPALRFQDHESLWKFDDQYMFGPDMLIAPTPLDATRSRRLYLPEDEWVHLWTSRHFPKGPTVVDAPEGKPAIFYRKRSGFAPLFDAIRQKATRL